MKISNECVFCDLIKKNKPAHIIYTTHLVSCFLDHDPISEGHVLVVPNEHFQEIDECPDDILLALMQAVKLIAVTLNELYHPDGITTMQNGGFFNDVKHLHIHLFPRYKNDGFSWIYPSEIQTKSLIDVAEKIKKTINLSRI